MLWRDDEDVDTWGLGGSEGVSNSCPSSRLFAGWHLNMRLARITTARKIPQNVMDPTIMNALLRFERWWWFKIDLDSVEFSARWKFEEKKIEPALKNKIRFFAGLKPGEEQKLKPKKTKKQKPKRKKIEQISEIASSLKQTFLHNVFGAHFRRTRTPQSL